MKKSFMPFLVLMMLFQCLQPVAAAATTEHLVFDLDLSSCESGASGSSIPVRDSAGTAATFTVGSSTSVGGIAGTTTKYLKFRNGTNSGLKSEDAAANAALQNEATIELWMQDTGTTNYQPFALRSLVNHSESTIAQMYHYGGQGIFVESGSKNLRVYYNEKLDDWTHYVITRSKTTGKQTLYVNGVLIGSSNIASFDAPITSVSIGGGLISQSAAMNGNISSFRVYDTVLTVEEILANYNAEKNNFVSPLIDIVSVSPNGGTAVAPVEVEPTAGTFTIIFDNSVKSSSLNAITLAKVGGGTVIINSAVSADSDKKVTVSYGSLDEFADYVLTIGSGLSSSYGSEMGKSYEFYYRTLERPSPIFLDIDFESDEYVVGEVPAVDDGLTYISTGVSGSKDNFLIREKNGDKYLTYSVSRSETAASSQLFYEFPEAVSNRSMIIEMGIRGYVEGSETKFGTSAREVMRVYNNSGYTSLMQLSRTTSKNEVTKTSAVAGWGGDFTSTPAEDSFNHIKIVISKDADGYYFYDIYDKTSSSVKYTRIAPTGNSAYDKITKIMLAHVYPVRDENYDNEGVAISYIKGYYIEHPRLAYTNSEDLTAKSERVKLYFDKAMDETTMASGTYTLTDSDGNSDVTIKYRSYDSVENCVTLEFSDYLIPGMAYTLTAQDMLDVDGAPVAVTDSIQVALPQREIECSITGFSDDSGSISTLGDMSEATGRLKAEYTVSNNTNAKRRILVFAQHYDKDGFVKKVCAQFVDVAGNTSNQPKSFTLAGSAYKEDDYVVLYIWDVTGGEFKTALVTPYKLIY